MAANRSSYINLYASEDKSDNGYRVEMAASQADFQVKGVQDIMFDFAQYQFKKQDDSVFDLETRFSALESDAVPGNNSAAIAQLQVDLATESNARQSGDLTNSNAITAETNARVTAVQAVQDALDVQEAKQENDRAASDAAIAQEVTDRQAAIAAEATARASDIAGLQSQITNILSNADPSLIDSIAELLSHITAEQNTLLGLVQAAQQKADACEARLDELLNQQS